MKLTKYPQSCLLLEKNGRRIVIDPGNLFAAKYKVAELGSIEAVLYTHQHRDHFEPDIVAEFRAAGVPFYSNAAVAELIGQGVNVIEGGKAFEIAGFSIVPHDLPHCKMPDGSDGPPHVGYIIDGNFFDPGDGIETQGVRVDHMALPIAGPSISFYHAIKFAKSIGATKVIPVHYDNNDLFPGNPHGFAQVFKDAEVIVLDDGQSVEV